MFKKDAPVTTGKVDTLIGAGTTVEGKVQGTGILRIEGRIRGEVVTDGDIIVGEKGEIRANIKARHVSIAGKVTGNILASGRMHLMASGHLIGDVDASTVVIDEGAQFKGMCRMNGADGGKGNGGNMMEKETPKEPEPALATQSTITYSNASTTEKREGFRSITHVSPW